LPIAIGDSVGRRIDRVDPQFGYRQTTVSVALIGAVYLLVVFGAAVLALMARDRLKAARWRRRNPPERLAEDRRRFERRLVTPDWLFYAEHLQRPVPAALVAWFTNTEAVTDTYAFDDYLIDFVPIDRDVLRDAWVVPGIVAFAASNGDPIYLKPGTGADESVFITFQDGGDTELLARSVEQFLTSLQVAAPSRRPPTVK
jgi:hypothetical protein